MQRLRHCLRRGDADAHPREQPGADIDSDRADVGDGDPGVTADELDRGCEGLRMAAAGDDLDNAQDAVIAAERDADHLRRCFDAERDHDAAHGSSDATSRSQRDDHRRSLAVTAMSRASS